MSKRRLAVFAGLAALMMGAGSQAFSRGIESGTPSPRTDLQARAFMSSLHAELAKQCVTAGRFPAAVERAAATAGSASWKAADGTVEDRCIVSFTADLDTRRVVPEDDDGFVETADE